MSALWVSNSGRVACDQHLGAEGTAALRANPQARRLVTALDYWARLTDADVNDPEWLAEFGQPMSCETCPRTCEQADCGNPLTDADVDGLCSHCAERDDLP